MPLIKIWSDYNVHVHITWVFAVTHTCKCDLYMCAVVSSALPQAHNNTELPILCVHVCDIFWQLVASVQLKLRHYAYTFSAGHHDACVILGKDCSATAEMQAALQTINADSPGSFKYAVCCCSYMVRDKVWWR